MLGQDIGIALFSPAHRILPGDIDALLRGLADAVDFIRMRARPQRLRAQALRVFIHQQTGLAIVNALGRAAAAHQQGGQGAGGRLAHHNAVGVKGGGEQEQITPAVIGAQQLAVTHRAGENAVLPQAVFAGKRLDIRHVRAIAHKQHGKARALRPGLRQAVQDQADALIPAHAADKEENGAILRQVMALGNGGDFRLRRAAAGEIHTVFHHAVFAPEAQRAQVFTRAVADRPHLVAGFDVAYHGRNQLILQ